MVSRILQEAISDQNGKPRRRNTRNIKHIIQSAINRTPSWPADFDNEDVWKEAIRHTLFDDEPGFQPSGFAYRMVTEPIHSNDPLRSEAVKRSLLPLLLERFPYEPLRILEVGASRNFIFKGMAGRLSGGDFTIMDPRTKHPDYRMSKKADFLSRKLRIPYKELTGTDAYHCDDVNVWLLGIANSLRPQDFLSKSRRETFIRFDMANPRAVSFIWSDYSNESDWAEAIKSEPKRDLTSPYHAIIFPTIFYMLSDEKRQACFSHALNMVHPKGYIGNMDLGLPNAGQPFGIEYTDSWFGNTYNYHMVVLDMAARENGFETVMTFNHGRPSRGYYSGSRLGQIASKTVAGL